MTLPNLAGLVDESLSSGTLATPLPLPPSEPLTVAGPSHPDEPRPLFGEPGRTAPTGPDEGPRALTFPDDAQSTKVRPVPNDTFSPKPLFADEPKSPVPDRAATSSSGPGALRFVDAPAPAARSATPTGSPSSATNRLNFPSAPAPATPKAPGQGHGLFESTESPLIRHGLEVAQQKFAQLWAEDGGAFFQRQLRQLLPLDRAVIDQWGSAVLDRVTDMANTTATVTRTYLAMNANETLNQALQDARAPAPGMWQRFVKPVASLDECRLRLSNLRAATAPLIAQVDQHEKDARAAAQRLARDLASLSVVTVVSASVTNNGVARSLDDRSALLSNSLRQAELLAPQLKNLATQMRDLNRQVDEALSVTFPALALARAARG